MVCTFQFQNTSVLTLVTCAVEWHRKYLMLSHPSRWWREVEWSFPEGMIHDGESARVAAFRTLREEAGIDAPGEPIHCGCWQCTEADEGREYVLLLFHFEDKPMIHVTHGACEAFCWMPDPHTQMQEHRLDMTNRDKAFFEKAEQVAERIYVH